MLNHNLAVQADHDRTSKIVSILNCQLFREVTSLRDKILNIYSGDKFCRHGRTTHARMKVGSTIYRG